MAGTLTISTLSDGTNSTSSTNCIQGSAKAWVNFIGSTAVIRASYNVSSVTRNATGDYTVNFTNDFADTSYAVVGTAVNRGNSENSNASLGFYSTNAADATTYTTSAVRIVNHLSGSAALSESNTTCIIAFR